MNTALLKNLWQRLLLLALLCVVGHGTCAAEKAEDAFKKADYFTVTRKGSALHFKLLTAHDDGYNFWSDGGDNSSKVKVTIINKKTQNEVPYTIARYSGESGNSNFKITAFYGAFYLTNCKNQTIYGTDGGSSYSGNTGGDGNDEHYLEFDWYPPQNAIENSILKVSFSINRRGNNGHEWMPWSGYSTGNYSFNNKDSFDLSDEVPTVTLSEPEFLLDKEQAVKGKVLSINSFTKIEPYSLGATFIEGYLPCSKKQNTFFFDASDETRKDSCIVIFLRGQKFDRDDYKFYKVESESVTIPAYHRIYNFGINTTGTTPRLTWEMRNVGAKDFIDGDSIVIQYSNSPNFTNAERVAFGYNLSDGSYSKENGFVSDIINSTETTRNLKFSCNLLGNNNGITYYRIQRQSTEKLGWAHSLVSFASTSKFISDLLVSVSTNSTEARNNLLDKGYKFLDYNLNHGVKGYYVYVGYKESDNPMNAISRIIVKNGSEWEANKGNTDTENGYTMKAVPYIGLCNGNLNAGVVGADPLYLYFSRDSINGCNKSVVTRLMHSGKIDNEELPTGFRFVGSKINDNSPVNLNSGCPQGTEEIRLICQLHEHVSKYEGKQIGKDIYLGHDCCGVNFSNALNNDGVLEISNADELYAFAELVNVANMKELKAKLTADIVVNENVIVMDNKDVLTSRLNPDSTIVKTFRNWEPIGNEDNRFCGQFDGNGHTISGLYCVQSSEAGLFGCVSAPAVISNVILKDSYIDSKDSYIDSKENACGGICGVAYSDENIVTIKNCTFDGVIVGKQNGGGILGYSKGGNVNIENCAPRGVINYGYSTHFGGIIGIITFKHNVVNVENCYSYVEFVNRDLETSGVGGIIGFNFSPNSTISNCHWLDNPETKWNEVPRLNVENCDSLSKEDFKSGKVTFLLNKKQDKPLWSQIIYTDPYPVFFDNDKHTPETATVYQIEGYSCKDQNVRVDTHRYSNHHDEAAVLVHEAEYKPAKQATCIESGNLEYWECENCSNSGSSRYFSNAECTTIISKIPTLEATAQHDYDVYTETCVNCGKTRHQIEEEEASAIEAVETGGIQSQMFDLHGRRVTDSHKGIVIIKNTDGKTYKMLKK